jgi:flagellar motor switch protein FliM
MDKVLNQQEIDALVRQARGGATARTEAPVVRWDYRQAGRLGREQMEAISGLHEGFARSLTHSMGAYLRLSFNVALVSAEHLSYREFVGSVPEGTYLSSCKLAPFGARGLVQLDIGVSFALIDVLLGGEGSAQPPVREVTEIEDQVLETVMRIICRELQAAWSALGLEFQFEQRQHAAQVQHLLSPDERVLCLSFEVTMKDCRGTMSVIVPAVISSALLRKISVARPKTYTQLGSPDSAQRLMERLLACRFRMQLGMDVRTSSEQLAGISKGMVLTFSRDSDGTCDLLAGTRPVFKARVARRGNNRAAQILGALEGKMERGAI